MPISARSKFIFVAAIALICALRFSFFLATYQHDQNLIIDPDTLSYLHISTAMFERGKYERVPGSAELHRPPGYPSFLVAHYALFGKDRLIAPVISQNLLTFLIALMVAWLAFQFGGGPAAALAAGLYLTDFTSFYYANEVLSETLFTFVLLGALVCMRKTIDSQPIAPGWLLVSGLVLTLAVFVRPVGLFLIYPSAALLGLYAYLAVRRPGPGLKAAGIFILPWVLLAGAWYLRSWAVSGVFTFTSYETGVFDQRLAAVFVFGEGVDYQTGIRMAQVPLAQGATALQAFFSIILEYPWDYLKATLIDMGRLLLSPAQWHLKSYFPNLFADQFPIEGLVLSGRFGEIAAQAARRPGAYLPVVFLVFLHLALVYAGLILSAVAIWKRPFPDKFYFLFLILVVGYFIAITLGFIGHARLRVPFMPVMAVLAGYGFSLIYTKIRTV